MSETTPLDQAYIAMDAAPETDAARMRFFETLASSELFMMLKSEPEGEQIDPEVFETEEGSFVLVFDREDRLAEFAKMIVPYIALPGRVIARELAGQGVGLGVNLGVAASSYLLPGEAMDWLAELLDHEPEQTEARITELRAPVGLPETLLTSLDTKLATAAGLARVAFLANIVYDNGTQTHILAIVDAAPEAESALAAAVNEALVFSGIEAGSLDVVFINASNPLIPNLAQSGLRFDLPEPLDPAAHMPGAPGMDPAKPPKLK